MSRLDRLLGLARSLLVYQAIPLRQRRLRHLYASIVRRGDLVFDVGAHAGNRTRALAALGCRVIAVEPQPHMADVLRTLFRRSARVTVVEAAVAASRGQLTLWTSERHPTLATVDADWRAARSQEPGFAGVNWDRPIDVTATTLDALIEEFGMPAFVKIDVEGAEPAVLDGLSRAVHALSFEYLPDALEQVEQCLPRLSRLGPYEFNWSVGETFRLDSEVWLDAPALLAALRTGRARQQSGDVYARLQTR